jgi:hypothetical protein
MTVRGLFVVPVRSAVGLLVLALYIIGYGLLAYGLSLIYPPLLFVTIATGFLSAAYLTARPVKR